MRSNQQDSWSRSDISRIAFLFLIMAIALVFTTFAARAYQRMQHSVADRWFQRGLTDLKSGRPEQAVFDLQSAMVYEHDNHDYVLNLARALKQAGKLEQAQAYFLGLWQREPGDGEVNLQLAQIAAQEHDLAEAEQHFNDAVFGNWDSDPVQMRTTARQEFISFLLSVNRKQEAESQLIALSAEAPPRDADLRMETGKKFLQAGDSQRALEAFQAAARIQPKNALAAAEAGKTAFGLGQFGLARDYLARATRLSPQDASSHDLLNTVLVIQKVNPFDLRIPYSERQSRILHDFEVAGVRLQACETTKGIDLRSTNDLPLKTEAEQWQSLKLEMTRKGLRENPDLMDAAMRAVFDIEKQTSAICGQPNGEDLALLTIGQERIKQ